jgi:hypothetical protein
MKRKEPNIQHKSLCSLPQILESSVSFLRKELSLHCLKVLTLLVYLHVKDTGAILLIGNQALVPNSPRFYFLVGNIFVRKVISLKQKPIKKGSNYSDIFLFSCPK